MVSLCSVLYDYYLYPVCDQDLSRLQLVKGVAQMGSSAQQKKLVLQLKQLKTSQNIELSSYEDLGGSCCNTLKSLASLGFRCYFSSCVGEDHRASCISLSIDQSLISSKLHSYKGESGCVIVLVSKDGDRTMLTNLGVNENISSVHLPAEKIIGSLIYHCCGYQWYSPDHKKATVDGIYIAKSSNTFVSLDLADPLVVKNFKDSFLSLIDQGQIDLVFANKSEITEFLGADYLQQIKNFDSRLIWVIKLGAQGAIIVSKNHTYKIDPIKVDVMDTTAAGDMFASGIIAGLIANLSLDQCGKLGSILASDVITRLGTTCSPQAIDRCRKILAGCF